MNNIQFKNSIFLVEKFIMHKGLPPEKQRTSGSSGHEISETFSYFGLPGYGTTYPTRKKERKKEILFIFFTL
jgi:hypothetical protein